MSVVLLRGSIVVCGRICVQTSDRDDRLFDHDCKRADHTSEHDCKRADHTSEHVCKRGYRGAEHDDKLSVETCDHADEGVSHDGEGGDQWSEKRDEFVYLTDAKNRAHP